MAAVKEEPVVVPLKLLVDEKKNRVVAAEANKDFVDILFSFLTFPMGTIIRLITSTLAKEKSIPAVTVGCMNKLYEGVQNLSSQYWHSEHCKNILLNPRNPLGDFCYKLKINIDDSGSEITYHCSNRRCPKYSMYPNVMCGAFCFSSTTEERKPDRYGLSQSGAFLKGEIVFLITDDLHIRPASPAIFAQLIPDISSRDWSSRIREMCVQVSKAEVICLLARSLVSESPISDVFLTDVPAYGTAGIQMKPLKLVSTFSSPASESLQNAEQSNDASVNLKVTLVKSTQEILFGEATNEFFDFMCSFLTTPIGSMMRVLEGQSGLKCMDNLYTSVLELDPNWFHSSNKCGLLDLCIAQDHNCKKQPIKSFNTKHILEHLISSRWSNNFTVEPSMFLVPDDFEVKPLSATSSFLLLKKLEISFSQTEERCVTVGMKEAISLLKAALTSTSSALTKGLGPFLQKHSP